MKEFGDLLSPGIESSSQNLWIRQSRFFFFYFKLKIEKDGREGGVLRLLRKTQSNG